MTSGGAPLVVWRRVQAASRVWPDRRGADGRGREGAWKRLWERRRRGLVRERIDAEHNDYVARIQELEASMLGPSSMSWACCVA